jgi:hypothetical protein
MKKQAEQFLIETRGIATCSRTATATATFAPISSPSVMIHHPRHLEMGSNQTFSHFQSHSSLKIYALLCAMNTVSNALFAANSVTLVNNWI